MMTSNQPYLLRAFYEWIVDNDLTPYILVDAEYEGTLVPQEHVKDGQIVLNVSPNACKKLDMSNLDVQFEARFGGVARQIYVPVKAIQAIYAKENGAGTMFSYEEESSDSQPQDSTEPNKEKTKGKPTLTVVK